MGNSGALPPNLCCRPGHYFVRREVSVLGRMPLRRELRETRSERVCHRDVPSNTVRAASSLPGSLVQCCLPLVVGALGALPPNYHSGPSHNLTGCEASILRRMPLSSDFGEK